MTYYIEDLAANANNCRSSQAKIVPETPGCANSIRSSDPSYAPLFGDRTCFRHGFEIMANGELIWFEDTGN